MGSAGSAISSATAAAGGGGALAGIGGALAAAAPFAIAGLGIFGLIKGLGALFGGLTEAEKIAIGAQQAGSAMQSAVQLYQNQFGTTPTTFAELGRVNVPITDIVSSGTLNFSPTGTSSQMGVSGGAVFREQKIIVEIDGQTLVEALGDTLIDTIRVNTGAIA